VGAASQDSPIIMDYFEAEASSRRLFARRGSLQECWACIFDELCPTLASEILRPLFPIPALNHRIAPRRILPGSTRSPSTPPSRPFASALASNPLEWCLPQLLTKITKINNCLCSRNDDRLSPRDTSLPPSLTSVVHGKCERFG
jgi:hypothetical protein